MAFTFNEKLESLKTDRTNALNQKVNAQLTKEEAFSEDSFNSEYLFGDGTFIGVNDLIYKYLYEKQLENGNTYTTPQLSNWNKTTWDVEIDNSLSQSGGDYYPGGITQQDIDASTAWLNSNGETVAATTGIINGGEIQSLLNAIGSNATDASNGRTSAYIYLSEAEAITAGQQRAAADAGTGIRGKRTQNADGNDGSPEIIAEESSPGSGSWRYVVGANGIDYPNYFNEPERSNLLNAITTLINTINLTSTYRTHLIDIYNNVSDIKNGTNTLFSESSMDADTDDDTTALQTLFNNFDTYIGTNTDVVTDNTLYGYYNYFSQFTAANDISGQAGYVQADFNTYLTSLETLTNTIDTTITNRYNSIDTLLGSNYSTAVTDFTKLKKWRYFWINQRLDRPNGARVTYIAMDDAIANAEEAIAEADEGLAVVLGSDSVAHSEYIPTPRILAAYYNPLIEKQTGIEKQKRMGVVWQGQQHATTYEIYRREISNVSLTNNTWSDVPYDTLTLPGDVDPDTGFLKIEYQDTNIDKNTTYAYKVRIFDNTHDTFNSASLESKVFNEPGISFTEILNGQIDFGFDHGLKKRQFVLIKMDEPDITIDGFIIIAAADETTITFSEDFNNAGSGTIYTAPSVASSKAPPRTIPAPGGATQPATPIGAYTAIYVAHEWSGTKLRVLDPDQQWGPFVNLQGPVGPPGPQGAGSSLEWDKDTPYLVNDIVSYEGVFYKAQQENTGFNPSLSPSYWKRITEITEFINDITFAGNVLIQGTLVVEDEASFKDLSGTAFLSQFSTFQDALDYLHNTYDGGTLYVDVDNFDIGAEITTNGQEVQLYSNISIEGFKGRQTTITSSNTTYLHFSGIDVGNIQFKNIRLVGPGIASPAGGGIWIHRSANSNIPHIYMENVNIEDVAGNALAIQTPILSSFINVKILNFAGHGFDMYGAGTSTNFRDCYAITGTGSGFYLQGMTYCSLEGCASEATGASYKLDNSHNISLISCGSEATVDRTSSGNDPGYSFYISGDANTLSSCYSISSAGNAIQFASGNFLSINSVRTLSTGGTYSIDNSSAGTTTIIESYFDKTQNFNSSTKIISGNTFRTTGELNLQDTRLSVPLSDGSNNSFSGSATSIIGAINEAFNQASSTQTTTTNINAAATNVIYSTALTNKAIKVVLYITGTSVYEVQEILLLNYNDTTVLYSQYSDIGDTINFNFSPAVNGANIELSITNNESFTITTKVIASVIS